MASNLFINPTVNICQNLENKHLFESLVFLIISMFCLGEVQAQDFYLPVNNLSIMRMERAGIPIQKGVHFGYKPVLFASANVEDVNGLGPDTATYYYKVTEKIFSQHLIELRKPGLKLDADLIFDFSYGQESRVSEGDKNKLYTNTRGFSISAQIGERVFVHTDFRENQGKFPNHINHFVDSTEVFPGNGRVKPFKEDGYDFSMANGYVGVVAADWLSINFGHGKQFVGHGYRSLLLSDNAFNYPYAGYILNFGEGKFQYRYTIQLMQNLLRLPLGDTPESIFKRKYANQNYLTYKPLKNLEVGLFESIVWKYFDDTTGTEPFNANALNPIPLVNSAIYGLNDPDANAVLGLNVAWQPFKSFRMYGQVMIDDFDTDRYGYQIGGKYFSLFKRFDFLAEYNLVSPGSYASANVLQGYTNFNQPLAHPMGAGFEEIIGQVSYYYNRIYVSAKYSYAIYSDSGRDPLIPEMNNKTYTLENTTYQELMAAYVFNPKTNFQMYARFTNRMEHRNGQDLNDQFWYIGLRTNLQNIYTDF